MRVGGGKAVPSQVKPGIPVVIPVGGQGTRMQGGTTTKKELVKVGGRPILWHVMKIFAAFGHTRFILALGYQADAIKRYFLEFDSMNRDFTVNLGNACETAYHQDQVYDNWSVTLADTGLLTEKAARIYKVAHYIEGERFFVTYGDGVGDVDLRALLDFHLSHGRLATITGVQARWQYGIVHAGDACERAPGCLDVELRRRIHRGRENGAGSRRHGNQRVHSRQVDARVHRVGKEGEEARHAGLRHGGTPVSRSSRALC